MPPKYKRVCPYCGETCEGYCPNNLICNCGAKYYFKHGIWRNRKNKKDNPDVVEIRHGEWGFDGLGWTCSECGEYALTNKTKLQVHSNYCPHCGAKMDGERREG